MFITLMVLCRSLIYKRLKWQNILYCLLWHLSFFSKVVIMVICMWLFFFFNFKFWWLNINVLFFGVFWLWGDLHLQREIKNQCHEIDIHIAIKWVGSNALTPLIGLFLCWASIFFLLFNFFGWKLLFNLQYKEFY